MFKVGDYVVCKDALGSKVLEEGKVYRVVNTDNGTPQVFENTFGHGFKFWSKSRFRKAIKRRSNPIIKKLCKNYIEDGEYVWI